jgi:uncharacterized protein YbjT (DUF2867 family)
VILVAGGTGRLGSRVVRKLAAAGHDVSLLSRHPGAAADLRGAEVTVHIGDVRDPSAARAAAAGADVVVSAVHGLTGWRSSPASVDRDGNVVLIDAAAAAGADVVLLSVLGATPGHPLELFRAKAAAEAHLRKSVPGWTVVRAGPFRELHEELLSRGPRPAVLGRGDTPVEFTSVDTVADTVATAVLDPATRGQVLQVAGSAPQTMNELAMLVQQRQGRDPHPPRHVPRGLLRALAATGHLRSTPVSRIAATALYLDTADAPRQPTDTTR